MKKATLLELVDVDDADQLHDVNIHWLELAMIVGEEDIRKARLS